MPIYTYTCQNCGYKTEAVRAIKKKDYPVMCEQCSSVSCRRDEVNDCHFNFTGGLPSYQSGNSYEFDEGDEIGGMI